jgi:uncharacterized protein (DUF302 family)
MGPERREILRKQVWRVAPWSGSNIFLTIFLLHRAVCDGAIFGIVEVDDMAQENGLIQVGSHYPVEETVRRLSVAFAEKGLQVFAVIDHSGEAEKVGLKMLPTKVVIFGSPRGGTPLMVAAPSLAIDLPLKALVAEDGEGRVSVTYNDPEYLRDRHRVPGELIKNLAGAGVVMAKAVE